MIDELQKLVPWLGSLPIPSKVFASLILVSVTGFILTAIWRPPHDVMRTDPVEPIQDLSIEKLKVKLDDLSKINANILQIVANAGKRGIYITDLEKETGLTRNDLKDRGEYLEEKELIKIHPLTDLNFRLHKNTKNALGDNARQFLSAYLK